MQRLRYPLKMAIFEYNISSYVVKNHSKTSKNDDSASLNEEKKLPGEFRRQPGK